MLRAGIVGTGWWTEVEHLPGLQSRSDVQVTALCGRNAQRLESLADKFRVPERFTNWQEMLHSMDVCVIVTPNSLHHPIAMAALEKGLHVICEKPLALTAAQAREMAAAASDRHLQTLTFFTHRTIAAVAQLKKLIDEGFLGTPLHVSATYFSASHFAPDKPASWRMRRSEAGTGVLGDIGSHVIDLVRFWLGDFVKVSGQWQQSTFERPGGTVDADEDVSFLAQLKCGAQGVFQASKLIAGRGNFQRVELYGDKGSLIYEAEPGIDSNWEGRLYAGRAGKPGIEAVALPNHLTKGLETKDGGRLEAYRRLVDPFFESIQTGVRSAPDFSDGAAVQAILDAVATSAEQSRWIGI